MHSAWASRTCYLDSSLLKANCIWSSGSEPHARSPSLYLSRDTRIA